MTANQPQSTHTQKKPPTAKLGRWAIVWAMLLLLGAGALAVRALPASKSGGQALIDTDLLAILPHYQDKTLRAIQNATDKHRNRQLLIAVSFPLLTASSATGVVSSQSSAELLQSLAQQLQDSGLFQLPDAEVQLRQHRDLSAALWDYRGQLLSPQDSERLQRGETQAVIDSAMTQLYGFTAVDEDLLRDDPLFLFQRYLQTALSAEMQSFSLHGRWLGKRYQQRQYYLLPLSLKQSAFDSDYQQAVKQILTTLQRQTAEKQGELSAVGAVIFAEQGFSQSKNELSTVGLGGLLGIVALLLLAFRSALPLLWLLSALAASLTMALSVALWWFGSLHIFALLFSAAIVGISADYGFHFFTDVYQHRGCRRQTIGRIFTGLTLGLLSSMTAYALFAWGGFAVLSQVAVLALVGLPSMYLTVVLLLPFAPLPNRLKPLPRVLQGLASGLVTNRITRAAAVFLQRPLVMLSLTAAVGGAVYLIEPNDNVRALQSLSPQTLADEQRLRTLFNRPYVSDYTVLVGERLDDLLAAERQWLNRRPDVFYTAQAVSRLLPDRKRQHANYQAYQQLYQTASVADYAKQLGDLPNLTLPTFQALNVAEIAKLPAFKQRFARQLIELPANEGAVKQWALLLPRRANHVGGNSVAHNVGSGHNANVRVYYLSPTADMSAQFAQYRLALSRWLAVAVGVLLLLGVWRYGRLGVTVALLPLLTALSAVAVAAAFGFSISLFSVLAVLLLLGMGLDYMIFLAESRRPDKVMVSLCLSCATTILSFGLLAFSQTAAVAIFGITVAVGMVLIGVLSPVVVSRYNGHQPSHGKENFGASDRKRIK